MLEIFLQGRIISTTGDALSAVSRGLCLQIAEDSGFVGLLVQRDVL